MTLPKPYYEDEKAGITIYNADCREILPLIPDKSIDIVLITDPPYGINLDLAWLSELNVAHSKPANKKDEHIIGDEGLDYSFLFKYSRWLIFGFPYINNSQSTGWLVWDKQPGLMETDRTLTTPVEMAFTNCWKGFRLVRCMWAGYMRDNGEYRYKHPTQKPQKVISYCIDKVTSSTDLILDPFLGSGTTLVCAKKLGRRAIGIEIEERYARIAVDRLSQEVMKLEE